MTQSYSQNQIRSDIESRRLDHAGSTIQQTGIASCTHYDNNWIILIFVRLDQRHRVFKGTVQYSLRRSATTDPLVRYQLTTHIKLNILSLSSHHAMDNYFSFANTELAFIHAEPDYGPIDHEAPPDKRMGEGFYCVIS
jgi:hypothetical protein